MDIYEKIEEQIQTRYHANVVIAGQSCSGKTTLANQISEHFKDKYSTTIICQDDYFKDLPDIPVVREGYLMDVPDAFCISELQHDVTFLLQYGTVNIPIYDIATNTRTNKRKFITSGQITIIEGLHTIHIFKNWTKCTKVYLDTTPDTCLKRRIARDTTFLDVSDSRVREYWNDCIQPMSERFIFNQKDFADIIIRR